MEATKKDRFLKTLNLFAVFVWRDFNIRYKQAVFGILWAIIQPLSLMLIFTFIFTYILPSNTNGLPRPIFFYSALLPWAFFSSSLNYASPSLVSHYNLIKKIYFPKFVIPLSGVVLSFVDFCIASTIFIGLLIFYQIPLTIYALWSIPLFFLLILLTVSFSLIFSSLNVYYRDVGLATAFIIQLWFFATPIFYTVNHVPVNLKIILFLNPLTFIIENMRRCLLEGQPVIIWQYFIVFILTSLLTYLSYKFFKITERKFADVI